MTSSAPDTVTCRLCRRQFSKYTCPTCNVPYCSLTCFRSEAHSQCSETFYKKEVESDIRAEPSKTANERQRMLELLKRFEEDSAAQGELESFGDEDEEDDESDISRRLQSVDLESTSPDDLWALLTPAEREKFLKAMEDPSSGLALQLLSSEELESEKQDPWWARSAVSENIAGPSANRYGDPPDPIQIPPSLASPKRSGPSLIYNICAFIAYGYTTRHLSLSHLSAASGSDSDAARALISQLTPFLTSRTSTTLHVSLDNVITDIHSRLPADSATSQLFVLLLRDATALLRPTLIVDEADTLTGPHARTLRMLGDLHTLFQARAYVSHKLVFYAASLGVDANEVALEIEREVQVREADLGVGAEEVKWERLGEWGQERHDVGILEVGP
ncbi:hypothetical protein DFH07DRAFT_1036143 [Mycena maculata]|uniref:HIT-type domain-containing protein n=1 Tax=Mycena maculata TaxID=230809 RepID=A0AAD7K4B4_9AGAR|nr:hypothetical protein DFH07DRAFT_1036143 [Mycena maculata]